MWVYRFQLYGLESRPEKQRKKTSRHSLRSTQLIALAYANLEGTLLVAIAAAVIFVAFPATHVRITSVTDSSGNKAIAFVTREQSVVVRGTVSNPRVSRIFLKVNGLSWPVTVDHGAFLERVALISGTNRIQASLDRRGLGLFGSSQPVRLAAAIAPADIWSELTWEGAGDIDLHLALPDNEECSYVSKTTQAGATLDFDNTVRDGPEHIAMTKASPGNYQFKVVYFKAATSPPREVPWSLTLRLRNGAMQRTYTGVLKDVGETQTVVDFHWP